MEGHEAVPRVRQAESHLADSAHPESSVDIILPGAVFAGLPVGNKDGHVSFPAVIPHVVMWHLSLLAPLWHLYGLMLQGETCQTLCQCLLTSCKS